MFVIYKDIPMSIQQDDSQNAVSDAIPRGKRPRIERETFSVDVDDDEIWRKADTHLGWRIQLRLRALKLLLLLEEPQISPRIRKLLVDLDKLTEFAVSEQNDGVPICTLMSETVPEVVQCKVEQIGTEEGK